MCVYHITQQLPGLGLELGLEHGLWLGLERGLELGLERGLRLGLDHRVCVDGSSSHSDPESGLVLRVDGGLQLGLRDGERGRRTDPKHRLDKSSR